MSYVGRDISREHFLTTDEAFHFLGVDEFRSHAINEFLELRRAGCRVPPGIGLIDVPPIELFNYRLIMREIELTEEQRNFLKANSSVTDLAQEKSASPVADARIAFQAKQSVLQKSGYPEESEVLVSDAWTLWKLQLRSKFNRLLPQAYRRKTVQ